MYFSLENRAKVRGDHPGLSFGNIGKELGDRWKKLTSQEKQKYQEKAAEDKKRYMNEKADYPNRCRREVEEFFVQIATNQQFLVTLMNKISGTPQPKPQRQSNKRKKGAEETPQEPPPKPNQPKNFKVLFQTQHKALQELDSQVKQQQQQRFLEGLAFLFDVNRKRQMMMELMMMRHFEAGSDSSDSDRYYDSYASDSDDGEGPCLFGHGPIVWSSDSDSDTY